MEAALFPVVAESDTRLPLYLTSVGHWAHQEPVRRPDGFPDYQWHHIVSGEGDLEIAGRRMAVKAGQGFCLLPNVPHRYEAVKGPWELYWVSFRGSLSAELLGQAGIQSSGVYSAGRPELAILHLSGLVESAQTSHPFAAAEHSKRLYAFLLDLRKILLDGSSSSEANSSRLHPVLRLIDEQLHRALTLNEMADAFGSSPQHFCAFFRKTLGMRPMEYVNREKIKRSKELMFREGGLPIRDVARRVGIDNPSYFSAVFRKLEGLSPEQFKRMHGLKT